MKTENLAAGLFAVLSGCLVSAYGDVHTNRVVGGTEDWTLPASYDDGQKPGENDVVIVPSGVTVTVKDRASIEVVSRLGKLHPESGSCIVFDLDDDDGGAYSVSAPITASGGRTAAGDFITGGSGSIVKRGSGTLVLAASGNIVNGANCYDHHCSNLTVEAGALMLPQGCLKLQYHYGRVNVSEGATLFLPTLATGASGNSYYVEFETLNGSGVVTNSPDATSNQLRVTSVDETSEFSGSLGGTMEVWVNGRLMLTGESSTYSGRLCAFGNRGTLTSQGGVIGVKKFGSSSDKASSIGAGWYNRIVADSSGGAFMYLGKGEKTNRDVWIQTYNPAGPFALDGGAHGGLEMTGTWQLNAARNISFELALLGSHADPCVIAGKLLNWESSGNKYAFHVTKTGSGTWRFADVANQTWSGGLAVKEGVLQFDSIAERGTQCALGDAMILTRPYHTAYDASMNVPYACALGSRGETGNTEGVLEFLGTEQSVCTTRPIVLDGDGALSVANAGASLAYADVSGLTSGESTLRLSAAAGTANFLADVVESNAVFSLVKDGPGEWRLSGRQEISGKVDVNEGKLVVASETNAVPYTWFRFSVKEMSDGKGVFRLHGIALYDKDGRQRNIDLKEVLPAQSEYPTNGMAWMSGEYLKLRPGEVCAGTPAWYNCKWLQGNDFYDFEKLFWGIRRNQDYAPCYTWRYGSETGGSEGNALPIDPDDESTWFRIVMRMPADSPEIVAYDLNKYKPYPVQWMMEGSTDGVRWDTLHTGAPSDIKAGAEDIAVWYSDGEPWEQGETRKDKGYAFIRTRGDFTEQALCQASSVSVAGGAELDIVGAPLPVRGLRVDASASGAGVIRNVVLQEAGTLEVTGYADGDALPILLENAGSASRLENWGLTINGAERSDRRIRYVNGEIRICRKGFFIVVR